MSGCVASGSRHVALEAETALLHSQCKPLGDENRMVALRAAAAWSHWKHKLHGSAHAGFLRTAIGMRGWPSRRELSSQ